MSIEWVDLGAERLTVIEPNTELPDGSATESGQWAVGAGECVLTADTRARLVLQLERAARRLRAYALAECANALHVAEPDPICPSCATTPAQPV